MSDNQKLPYIKIYEENVPQFEIAKMHYSIFPDLATMKPHRHDYQTIIWTMSGTGRHLIDGHSVHLVPNTFCMIAKGQVHQFIAVDTDFALISVRFNDAFLPETTFGQKWSYRATLFNTPGPLSQTLLVSTNEVTEIASLLQLMEAEYERTDFLYQRDGLRLLLQFLLLRIEYFQQTSVSNLSGSHIKNFNLYQAFVTLLEEKFKVHRSVIFYADALHVSSSKLSEITRLIIGKSTKQIILDRVILEAKRLLQFTDASIKEIAYELGYSNPFHFSHTFKNQTQSSPDEYRTHIKKMV